MNLALRNLMFTVIVPGTVCVYIPWLILTASEANPEPVVWPAIILAGTRRRVVPPVPVAFRDARAGQPLGPGMHRGASSMWARTAGSGTRCTCRCSWS